MVYSVLAIVSLIFLNVDQPKVSRSIDAKVSRIAESWPVKTIIKGNISTSSRTAISSQDIKPKLALECMGSNSSL